MICEVMLHGHSNLWSFEGSSGVSSWLGRLPWIRQGGVAVVRSSSRRETDFLVEGITRGAYGANAGDSNLRVRSVLGDGNSSPMDAIFSELGISLDRSRFEQRRQLTLDLREHRYLFVLTNDEPISLAAWDDLLDTVDYCSKSGMSTALATMVIDSHRSWMVPPGIPTFEMHVGRPTVPVMSHAGSELPILWQAYVHQRIAWETAGNVSAAIEADQTVSDLGVGDDEGLENCFNQYAERFVAESPDGLYKIGNYLKAKRAASSARVTAELENRERQLLDDRFLWFPPGSSSPKITPTICRALARNGTEPQAVWGIRNSLVCAPLANEIFEVCIHTEHAIRAKLLSATLAKEPCQQAVQSFERFKRGEDRAVCYPNGHPLPLLTDCDVWAFASLGDILNASPLRPPDLWWNVLYLRNAVAHGHYVCWKHVMLAAEIVRAMVL